MSVLLKSNSFWGKRSGSYDKSKPKGISKEVGNVFWQMQWGTGTDRNTPKQKRNLLGPPHILVKR